MTLTKEEIYKLQAQGCPCCGDQIDAKGHCVSDCGAHLRDTHK